MAIRNLKKFIKSALGKIGPELTAAGLAIVSSSYFFGFIPRESGDHIIVIHRSESTLNNTGQFFSAVQSSFDSISNMYLTIHIGLFVLIGAAFTFTDFRKASNSRTIVASCAAFLLVSFLTIYTGYTAKFEMFEQVQAASLEFSAVSTALAKQALLLTLCAIIALYIAMSLFVRYAKKY